MKTTKVALRKMMILKACLILFIPVFFLSSCMLSSVRLNQIPQPLPSAKLRIHVVAVTSGNHPSGAWKVPPEEYASNMARSTARMLQNLGIYEVVPASDVQLVLGDRKIAAWEWKRNDWALAKEVGKAVHADYILCTERSFKLHLQQDFSLINLHTGSTFNVSNYLPRPMTDDQSIMAMMRVNYRTLFKSAQSDLLKTALNKGKAVSEEMKPVASGKGEGDVKKPGKEHLEVTAKQKIEEEPQDIIVSAKAKPEEKQLTAEEKQIAFEKEMEKVLTAQNTKQHGSRIVVYDFDSAESLRIVGLILAEALREELYKLGGFVLVNRENMAQVMDERKLQQSGLVNEKQAIKLGEWMAASEAVTGKIAFIGSSSILQVKRIDIRTMGTLSLGSLKCKAGEEDELLTTMPELARKLTQLQKQQQGAKQ
jgi:hypothetical protein